MRFLFYRKKKKMKKYTFVQAGTLNRLYSVSSKSELNSFVANEIEPKTAFLESSSAVVDTMVSFLQTNLPRELIPRKVIKVRSEKWFKQLNFLKHDTVA